MNSIRFQRWSNRESDEADPWRYLSKALNLWNLPRSSSIARLNEAAIAIIGSA